MDRPSTSPARNRRRRSAVLGIVAVLAVATTLCYLLRPRPVPSPRTLIYTPHQAAIAQGHIEAFRDELVKPETPEPEPVAAAAAAAAGMSHAGRSRRNTPLVSQDTAPIHIPLTEQDINTVLATNAALKAILRSKGVQAVQVSLRPPNRFMIRAALVLRKRPVNAQIDGRLLPFPPTLVRIVATHVQAGSILLPPALVTAQANKIIGRFAQKLHGRLPFIVQSVRVSNHTLVLIGMRTQKRVQSQGI